MRALELLAPARTADIGIAAIDWTWMLDFADRLWGE